MNITIFNNSKFLLKNSILVSSNVKINISITKFKGNKLNIWLKSKSKYGYPANFLLPFSQIDEK